jgi:calcineurin-like phosphoesterase family protein
MSNVYFISDLHFGHKRITSFEDGKWRTGDNWRENMDYISDQWIKTVRKKHDLVWVLGDVAFNQEGFDRLKELPGRKKMVRGNHDNYFSTQQWLEIFETVESLVNYKGHWLSHCPLHPDELRGKKNIHGHVHHNSIKLDNGEYDPRYINTCAESIWETPIYFQDIKSGVYYNYRRV